MRKKLDEAWAEEMRKSMPPVGYRMTLAEGWALMSMGDPLYLVSAAYNYGFKRGQSYERNKSLKMSREYACAGDEKLLK